MLMLFCWSMTEFMLKLLTLSASVNSCWNAFSHCRWMESVFFFFFLPHLHFHYSFLNATVIMLLHGRERPEAEGEGPAGSALRLALCWGMSRWVDAAVKVTVRRDWYEGQRGLPQGQSGERVCLQQGNAGDSVRLRTKKSWSVTRLLGFFFFSCSSILFFCLREICKSQEAQSSSWQVGGEGGRRAGGMKRGREERKESSWTKRDGHRSGRIGKRTEGRKDFPQV